MKTYHFHAQAKSDDCPAVPRAVVVASAVPSLKDATERLAKVLKDDPKLEKEHPELLSPEANVAKEEEKPQTRKRKNS